MIGKVIPNNDNEEIQTDNNPLPSGNLIPDGMIIDQLKSELQKAKQRHEAMIAELKDKIDGEEGWQDIQSIIAKYERSEQ